MYNRYSTFKGLLWHSLIYPLLPMCVFDQLSCFFAGVANRQHDPGNNHPEEKVWQQSSSGWSHVWTASHSTCSVPLCLYLLSVIKSNFSTQILSTYWICSRVSVSSLLWGVMRMPNSLSHVWTAEVSLRSLRFWHNTDTTLICVPLYACISTSITPFD